MYQKTYILKICSCLVAKSYPTLWDPMDCTTQASLSFTISQSLLKLMPMESVMPSNHLILCHPFLLLPLTFPATGSFPMSQLFSSGGHSTGASASASVLPKNIQGWFPLGWTGLISLPSKGLLRVFSSTTIQKYQFLRAQPSLRSNSQICTWLLEKPVVKFDHIEICWQSDVSAF